MTTQQFVYDASDTLYATLDGSGVVTNRLVSDVIGPNTWIARA